ncbi:MAG: hypothetical protein ABR563_14080 [Pyrinomonadaceae bacterium]
MTSNFARWLAYVGGVLAPLAETVRRWHTWRENPSLLFDDYIIGALLIYGAWRAGRDARGGQRFLAAAWGFACGMGYASFCGQLYANAHGVADPAPEIGRGGRRRQGRRVGALDPRARRDPPTPARGRTRQPLTRIRRNNLAARGV